MVIIEQTYSIDGDLGCGLAYKKPITLINTVLNREKFITKHDEFYFDTLNCSQYQSSDETRNKR